MPGRIIGGIFGWLIGVLPIVGLDVAEYFGLYLPNPEFFGALALVIGVILGGIASGYLGGRPRGEGAVTGGAAGASITGGISSVLYVISTVALLLFSASQGGMTSISSGQLLHVAAALLFFTALWLGIAMLTGFLTGSDTERQESSPPYRQTSHPRYTDVGNAGRSFRPVTTSQVETNDYNRSDRTRLSGWLGDYPDSGSSSQQRYPDRERDPRFS
jgi:hypothetical protein